MDMLAPSIAKGGMTALTTAAIGKAGVNQRGGLIAAATDRADDLVDHVHEVRVVTEFDLREFEGCHRVPRRPAWGR